MDIPNNDEQMEGIGTSLGNAQSLSLLQEAQKRRQARERTLFLDVPSWDGDLICEYRVLSPEEMRRIAERSLRRARNGQGGAVENNDITVIVSAAVGLYMKDPDSDERVAIEDEFGHVSYIRIAKLLGKDGEIDTAADAVRYVMSERDEEGGWVENLMAMSLHAQAIGKWMKDPSKREVDLDELLGEL